MKEKIENAIRTTLVIENKESIHLAVDKIMTVVMDRINDIEKMYNDIDY